MTQTDFPINIPQEITDLTVIEQLILCEAAFTGYSVDKVLIDELAKKYDRQKTEIKKLIENLKAKRLLEYEYVSWNYVYIISHEYHIYALFLLYTRFYNHVSEMKNDMRGMQYSIIASQLNKCVASIVMAYNNNGAKLFVPDFTKPPHHSAAYISRLGVVAHEECMLPLLKALRSSVLVPVLEYNLKYFTEKGIKLLPVVRSLWQDSKLRKPMQSFADMLCFNMFVSTGEWIFDEFNVKANSGAFLFASAIREAYKRNISEAYSLTLQALKLSNKEDGISEKNVLRRNLSNYFLMLIYALMGTEDAIKRLEQATRKKTICGDRANAAAYALAMYYRDTKEDLPYSVLAYTLYPGNANIYNHEPEQLAYLIVRYFDIEPDKVEYMHNVPDLTPSKYIPANALLRHELSAYLPITDAEKKRLEKIYGGKPLLSSKHRKAKWEIVLEDIYRKESGKGDSSSEQMVTARGIYLFNAYSNYIEVREQTRLQSGAWGKGKRLSDAAYSAGRFTMDGIDHRIHDANRATGRIGSMPLLSTVVPYLVGTDDRLYLSNYDMVPITVVSEKPFVSLVKDNHGIHLNTNISSKANLDNTVVIYFDEKTQRMTYYPMNQHEHQLLRQLSALGTLPLEAEPLLQKVFPVLNGKVEVHTDFIEGAEQLKEEKGQTVVCLRIVPDGADYLLTPLITPLQGGQQVFTPGQGNRTIYDERDGERYQVNRNMKGERRNLAVFTDFLEDEDVDVSHQPIGLAPEELIEFMDFVHDHPEEGFIEWPDGEKIRLKMADPKSWNVSLKKNNGWFDIEGDVKVDDDTVLTMGQLLDMVSLLHGRFIKLADDQYLALSESLRKQLQRLSALAVTTRGKTHIPNVGVALIGDALSGDIEIKHPKAVDELRTKIRQSAKMQPAVPDELNATLRDYQLDGYQWMCRLDSWGAGACLSDDMGLGKTVQAIAFMLDKQKDGAALVIAPASVVPNWRSELHRFSPSLNVVVLNEETDRQQTIQDVDAGTVLITTYGLLITQEEALVEKRWGTICLDEAHTIKNRDTKMSGVCMKLQSQHRMILTGTPLQNHLGELWNLFQFVNPGLLGSYEQFQRKFINPIESGDNEDRRQQLRRIIKPFMLRRTKQEVAKELPDKEEITLHVELSEDEMAVYEVIRRRAKEELEDIQRNGSKVNMNALAEITRLRMASCSAQLAEKKWKGNCTKLEQFVELVSELRQGGHRALVFSQFTSFLEMAKKALDSSVALKGLKYFYLDGSTPMKKREEMVKKFQKGECDLFVISLKAGGLGLNLTGANYVIHLDPWWNPAIEQQATDRAYRIGQKEKVTVYHLISANTIEEKILRLHEHKRDLATSLLEGTNQSHKITASDLFAMIDGEE